MRGNTGPRFATSARLSVTLPSEPGVTVSKLKGNGWTCQTGMLPIRCTIGQISVGGAADVTLEFIPPLNLTRFPITVKIDSATFDPEPVENSQQLRIYNRARCPTFCGTGSIAGSEPGAGGEAAGGCAMARRSAFAFDISPMFCALLFLPLLLRRRIFHAGRTTLGRASLILPRWRLVTLRRKSSCRATKYWSDIA